MAQSQARVMAQYYKVWLSNVSYGRSGLLIPLPHVPDNRHTEAMSNFTLRGSDESRTSSQLTQQQLLISAVESHGRMTELLEEAEASEVAIRSALQTIISLSHKLKKDTETSASLLVQLRDAQKVNNSPQICVPPTTYVNDHYPGSNSITKKRTSPAKPHSTGPTFSSATKPHTRITSALLQAAPTSPAPPKLTGMSPASDHPAVG